MWPILKGEKCITIIILTRLLTHFLSDLIEKKKIDERL